MSRHKVINGADTDTTGAAAPDFLEGFISEAEYAERCGISRRSCQRARQMRQSPPFVTVGRRVYYRVEAVRDWLLAREQHADRRPSAPHAGSRR